MAAPISQPPLPGKKQSCRHVKQSPLPQCPPCSSWPGSNGGVRIYPYAGQPREGWRNRSNIPARWPAHIAAKPSGKNKAANTQRSFPHPSFTLLPCILHPSLCNALEAVGTPQIDSTVWLAVSGYKEAALGTHRLRAPSPATPHHRVCVCECTLRGRGDDLVTEGTPTPQGMWGIFHGPATLSHQDPRSPSSAGNRKQKLELQHHLLESKRKTLSTC